MREANSSILLVGSDPFSMKRVRSCLDVNQNATVSLIERDSLLDIVDIASDVDIVVLVEPASAAKAIVESILSIHEKNEYGLFIVISENKQLRHHVYGECGDIVDVVPFAGDDCTLMEQSVSRAMQRRALARENSHYRKELETANKSLKEYIRVLERDQQAGRRVQKKLLPRAPVKFERFHVDYTLIPSLYLSGDTIDYGLLANRFFAFYLCDVSGHGAAPAFITVWLRQLVRRYFYKESLFTQSDSIESDMSTLLSRINNELMKSNLGSHATSLIGLIDTTTYDLYYVVAGHLPLPVLTVNGRSRYLEGKGKPLGIFEDTQWDIQSLKLPKEQAFSLTVFSDGVLEVLPPDNLIDKENYLLELMSRPSSDVVAICEHLMLDRATHSPDDIAVLKIDSEMLR